MIKILIPTLISSFVSPLALNNVNLYFIKEKKLESEWINQDKIQIFNNYSNPETIYEDKIMNINLIKENSNQAIVQIYAKTPEKKYYLNLKNLNSYEENNLSTYIKNKFLNDQTTEENMSSDEFFTFLNTSEIGKGQILENGELGFRSSWGVMNSAESSTKTSFLLHEKDIKNHLIVLNEEKWGQLNHKNIEIVYLIPKSINTLPIVKISSTPINKSFFATNKIIFNQKNLFSENFNAKQEVDLPKGSNSGQEWWNWFKTASGVMLSSVGIILSILATIITGGAAALTIASIVASIGAVSSDIIFGILEKNDSSLMKQFDAINKIKNELNKNKILIKNNHKIIWDNLQSSFLPIIIDGRLYGEGKSTAIFGQYSKMNLHQSLGIMNSELKYRVYNNA